MSEKIRTDLEQLILMLKAHGVLRFQDGAGLVIELGPPAPKAMSPQDFKSLAAEDDSDKCRCGHHGFAHMNGLCTAGCAMELCLPEDAKQ